MQNTTKTITALCAATALTFLAVMPTGAAVLESPVGTAGVSPEAISPTETAKIAEPAVPTEVAVVTPETNPFVVEEDAASETPAQEPTETVGAAVHAAETAAPSPTVAPKTSAVSAASAQQPTAASTPAAAPAPVATPEPALAPITPAPVPVAVAAPAAPAESTPASCEWEGYVLDSYSANCAAQKQAAAASISVDPDLGPAVSLESNFDGTYKVWANGVQIAFASADGEGDVIDVLFQISRDHAKA